jgi:hypothetical protein
MEQLSGRRVVGTAAKIGAILFLVWGVLHLWVGFQGVHQYLTTDTKGLWEMLLGGSNAPRSSFQHTTDALTAHAQAQLILNFTLDVGAAGLLGLAVAWLIWFRGSWAAYFIGVVVIGVFDNAFLFSLVTPGIIELNAGSIGGPVLWFLACVVTPFGMPSIRQRKDLSAK